MFYCPVSLLADWFTGLMLFSKKNIFSDGMTFHMMVCSILLYFHVLYFVVLAAPPQEEEVFLRLSGWWLNFLLLKARNPAVFVYFIIWWLLIPFVRATIFTIACCKWRLFAVSLSTKILKPLIVVGGLSSCILFYCIVLLCCVVVIWFHYILHGRYFLNGSETFFETGSFSVWFDWCHLGHWFGLHFLRPVVFRWCHLSSSTDCGRHCFFMKKHFFDTCAVDSSFSSRFYAVYEICDLRCGMISFSSCVCIIHHSIHSWFWCKWPIHPNVVLCCVLCA